MARTIMGIKLTPFELASILIAAKIFVIGTIVIFHVIYYVQPTPFIDEIFHVPQAQKYCNWSFQEWDQKITTLPGLYLMSAGILVPVSSLLGINLCSVYWLRFLNMITAFANFYLIFKIQKCLRPWRDTKTAMLQDLMAAFNLATFPVLYFFSFFYYTDTLSTFLVLLMYLLELEKCSACAAAIGFIAVMVRQTNIVWVFFVMIVCVSQRVKEFIKKKTKETLSPNFMMTLKYLKVMKRVLELALKRNMTTRMDLADTVGKSAFGYVLVGVAFLIFVCCNKGLVVGDRSAHQPVIHIPQVFYFFYFTAIFAFPCVIDWFKNFAQFAAKYKMIYLFLQMICSLVICLNTLAHPYLLADNRHYTFYLWKRFYQFHYLAKYFHVTSYLLGGYVSYKMLKETDIIFRLGFYFAVVMCILPQKLLEFRYFIIPFVMLRLHFCSRKWWQLVAEQAFFFAVNCATIFIFLTRVFYWPDTDEEQHIIW